MTSLFPHPPYAEDQPHAHFILYLHICRATAMTGSFISLFTSSASLLLSRYRYMTLSAFLPRLLKHSGRGLVVGSLLGGAMTWGRMRGKEEVEWQDRAWRLLENKRQMRTDWWAVDGAVVGMVIGALAARRGVVPVGVGRGMLGGAGVGTSIGVPYMMGSFAVGRNPA